MAEQLGFLQNVDQEEGLDKEAILADMDAIADEMGDWKDHVPYEAAIEFYSDDAIREMYSDHLDGCQYCQEMLETLNPSEKILGNLHQFRNEEAISKPRKENRSWGFNFNSGFAIAAIAASVVGALFIGIYVGDLSEVSLIGDTPVTVVEYGGRDGPTSGEYFPSGSFEDLFFEARLNLENGSERLAYAQMASGFDEAGLDEQFVDAVYVGPSFMRGTYTEADVAKALAEIRHDQPMMRSNLLLAIRLNAAAGNHNDAALSMAEYMSLYGNQPRALKAFEELVLQEVAENIEIE